MTDDFCRAVRQALPDIAQSVVTAMEDDLADCRTRLAEVEAENGRLRMQTDPTIKRAIEVAAARLPVAYQHCGCDVCEAVRAALAQTTEKDHDDG